MSPRQPNRPKETGKKVPPKSGSGMDRGRHLEDARHHPLNHPLPHPEHKTLKKPPLPPKHTPHSHPHGDDLPAHTNPPGPIKPSKRMTKTGTQKKI
ncbi:MAG: hypothetical protein ABSG49_03700 [Methanoregula sp.]|uniref:hypothetical protein n=1 Tax=Methanoregula sp. TaxID=2052170 RepID=UPI003C19E12D